MSRCCSFVVVVVVKGEIKQRSEREEGRKEGRKEGRREGLLLIYNETSAGVICHHFRRRTRSRRVSRIGRPLGKWP
jgi:predicted transposase YdaD